MAPAVKFTQCPFLPDIAASIKTVRAGEQKAGVESWRKPALHRDQTDHPSLTGATRLFQQPASNLLQPEREEVVSVRLPFFCLNQKLIGQIQGCLHGGRYYPIYGFARAARNWILLKQLWRERIQVVPPIDPGMTTRTFLEGHREAMLAKYVHRCPRC